MSERDDEVRRLAEAAEAASRGLGQDYHNFASLLYDAGARLPAPPPAPEIVVSPEAIRAARLDGYSGSDEMLAARLRAALPHLLADNPDYVAAHAPPAAIDAAIRERVRAAATHGIVEFRGTMDDLRVCAAKEGSYKAWAGASEELVLRALGVEP